MLIQFHNGTFEDQTDASLMEADEFSSEPDWVPKQRMPNPNSLTNNPAKKKKSSGDGDGGDGGDGGEDTPRDSDFGSSMGEESDYLGKTKGPEARGTWQEEEAKRAAMEQAAKEAHGNAAEETEGEYSGKQERDPQSKYDSDLYAAKVAYDPTGVLATIQAAINLNPQCPKCSGNAVGQAGDICDSCRLEADEDEKAPEVVAKLIGSRTDTQ